VSEPIVIYETVHGSHAYGMERAGSDTDIKGVIIGPRHWYFGHRAAPEQVELHADHVRYELRKFVRLAADANPTILELLWTHPEHHRIITPAGQRLLDNRDLFLSSLVADRFGRYALAQLKRIRTHRDWLLHPPAAPPTRSEFGLPDRTVIPADQLAAAERLIADGRADTADVSPNFLELLARERRYKAAQTHWSQYQRWVDTRNPARAELEARHGYDTKHAMHLVRLQRMAVEILVTHRVNVHRADRDELLAVRDGAWSYDDLITNTERLATAIDDALQSTTLPPGPDHDTIDALCVELIAEQLRC
jgi:predicted nucleotidyltransferase